MDLITLPYMLLLHFRKYPTYHNVKSLWLLFAWIARYVNVRIRDNNSPMFMGFIGSG